jgi:hypothetical protein
VDIPTGAKHLDGVVRAMLNVHQKATQDFATLTTERELLGTSLSALYQVATCHRKCFGGAHVLESLSGRIYNLAVSAYQLAISGFYDESLNLTRSIGEIANLISLSVVDKTGLSEWLYSDTKTRITKFGPGKIRAMLKKHDSAVLIANDDWYAEFCEKYTHVTPQTRPNLHAATGQAHVGGEHDTEEIQRVLGELSTIVGSVAMIACKYADLDDLFDDIVRIVGATSSGDDAR